MEAAGEECIGKLMLNGEMIYYRLGAMARLS